MYFLVLGHLTEGVLSVTCKLEEVIMEDPDSRSVTNGDESNAAVFHVGVEMSLYIDRYSTGAFIENSVLGLVVK